LKVCCEHDKYQPADIGPDNQLQNRENPGFVVVKSMLKPFAHSQVPLNRFLNSDSMV
jgi:hypothetical protein